MLIAGATSMEIILFRGYTHQNILTWSCRLITLKKKPPWMFLKTRECRSRRLPLCASSFKPRSMHLYNADEKRVEHRLALEWRELKERHGPKFSSITFRYDAINSHQWMIIQGYWLRSVPLRCVDLAVQLQWSEADSADFKGFEMKGN